MICRNCGENNNDSARFCQVCGESLGNDLGFAEIPSGTAVTTAIKGVAGSGMFLIATLFFTAVIVLKVLGNMQGITPYLNQIENLLSQYSAEIQANAGYSTEEIMSLLNSVASPSLAKSLSIQVGPIIYAICLWMIFISGKTKGVSTVGITIIKVFTIIKFVIVILLNVISIGGLVYAVVMTREQAKEASVILAIAAGVVLVLFIFQIVYLAKLVGSLTAAKTAFYGDPTGKFSGFVAFILIASAIISLIANGIASVAAFNAYNLAAAILSALATLLYGLMIGKARNAVRAA